MPVKNTLFYFILACSALWLKLAGAQNNTDDYDHYSVNNGLPTQTTYNILHDKNGFLWIATNAGVSCFDGKSFINYTTEDGLGDNEILDILQDKKGRIWFKPFSNKLSYYFNNHFYNEDNDSFLKSLGSIVYFNFPVEDASGIIYTRAKNNARLVVKINSDNTFSIIDLTGILGEDDEIQVLSRNTQRTRIYCISKHNKMILLSGVKPQSIQPPTALSLKNETIEWLPNFQKPELLLYLDAKGIHSLSDTGSSLLLGSVKLKNIQNKFTVLMDQYRHIWISDHKYNTCFYRYINGSYASPVHLLKDIFTIMAFDHEDNIWFCTGNRGLYKLSYHKLVDDSLLRFKPQLLQKNMLCTYSDADKNLWIGYSNGYITQISGNAVKHYNLNTGTRTYNRVLQITGNKTGDIWCSTDETCIRLKKTGLKKYTIHKLITLGSTKGISFNKEGDAFITMPMAQVHWSNRLNKQVNDATTSKITERTYSSFFDAENRWYISTLSGLVLIEGSSYRNLALDQPILKTRIQHFAENSNGVLFLATYSNGLIALKNTKVLATLNRHQGLAGVICRRIYIRADTLYIATNGGITRALFEHDTFNIIKNLGLPDGLPSIDVNDFTFLNNTLYAATSEGIAAIKLNELNKHFSVPPATNITGLMVNENEMDLSRPAVFPFAQQRIRVSFVAPVMERPEALTYRYRFAGRKYDWHETKANGLEFNDLPHGIFNLEIQAKKYNSDWGAPTLLSFTITAPFYTAWWFRLLTIFSAGFVLYFLTRVIVTRRFSKQLAILKQTEAIEKERNRIAADIHDDIGSELTNIVIQARILKKYTYQLKPVSDMIDKLERSSNEVITKVNEVIWTLNKANDTLHNLAAYLRNYISGLLEENNLQGNIKFDDAVYCEHLIKAELSRNILLIIKESFHNIVKHSQANCIEVSLKLKSGNNLNLLIHDNGIGFNMNQNCKGNGMHNIKKRTQQMNGSAEIISRPGAGCIINITIPL